MGFDTFLRKFYNFFINLFQHIGFLFLIHRKFKSVSLEHLMFRSRHSGPDHVLFTLLHWDIKSVLVLNKKLKVNWKFQFFINSAKTLLLAQLSKVNCS